MSNKSLSVLLFILSAVALAIAVYQLIGSRLVEGMLSVVFSAVFLVGGVAYRRR